MTLIKVVCMDCGGLIRWKDGEGVTGTSHGLCGPCEEVRQEQSKQRIKDKGQED